MRSILFVLLGAPIIGLNLLAGNDTIPKAEVVTLKEAHIGDAEIDIRLLNSYGRVPHTIQKFYSQARQVFFENSEADFTDAKIVKAARKNGVLLMGGPLLGDLRCDGVTFWLRPANSRKITIAVYGPDGSFTKEYPVEKPEAGREIKLRIGELTQNTTYHYQVFVGKNPVAEGGFRTAPREDDPSEFTMAFGSCFHKIGLHNPNLVQQILNRKPQALLLLGDIAVDDRENHINRHRADYLLRDLSAPWQKLAANVPLYTTWDDHDYLNNDLSGLAGRFTDADRTALRAVWEQNWNNPQNPGEGVYFNTRIGPVEVIMLDTRSCRQEEKRGQYGSYLGQEQMTWLKETLRQSDAPFKILTSGTMWSDYVTKAKDSWGTWDTLARREIFSLIEAENIPGVLLLSGDRHGARGFTVPGPDGFEFYELEVAALGGVPGPPAMARDASRQLFGYHGSEVIAFGELVFNVKGETPGVVFRLVDQSGSVLEQIEIPYASLQPNSNRLSNDRTQKNGSASGQNPFIRHKYTADPSARVFKDTLYVYPSHDQDTATWFSMVDWHVFSTVDMVNWTDHGQVFSLDDISWADSEAWAPDCIEHNGQYYFYYPVEQSKIGVAVSDRPYGPFVDPLDSALIHIHSEGVICNRDFIDPAVFIDDDGQAYLYMGQLVVNAVRLNDDMISYKGSVYHLEGTDDFFEAIWMHKYKGSYYLSYVGTSGEIKYCMSDNPLGPFEYKGVILPKMNSGTSHHSIVNYKGQWYLFYHNSDLYFKKHPDEAHKFGWGHKGSNHPFRRSICFDKLFYNQDGTIKMVVPTNT